MASQLLKDLALQSAIIPKESPFATRKKSKSLTIGLPKEISYQENRIGLTPDAVSILVRNGHEINVEKGAGDGANFSDEEYSNAGARLVYSHKEVFASDVILKIEPLVSEEFEIIKPESTLISTLNLPNLSKSYFDQLNDKKITGIAFEHIEDKVGDFPVIRAMSEIAGSTVLLIAAEYLNSIQNGKGIILGGITGVPPTRVVILGAGTVAEYATRTALGLGADIKVFDTHIYRLQRLQYAVGNRIFTSIIDSETLSKALEDADVVIGAMRGEKGQSPMVVTEEMVSKMKPNSIIIDVAIDQGGCFETSEMTNHREPVFKKHDVIHYCVPNIASRFAHTASITLSNIFSPFLIKTGTLGGIEEMIFTNKWFMKGVYTYKGSITNYHLAQKFNLRYRDLGLLLAARI
ncbi:alanine dehydrogenase [Emticicia sp. CRIBPO]|nr:alanine dehydrogenase [Emticicia sp. CRIBPO]NBA88513.1 alanine dehydrogenase [Emticicia sp. CRIBPO]